MPKLLVLLWYDMSPALASRGSSVNGGELRLYGGVLILGEGRREEGGGRKGCISHDDALVT